MNIISRLEERIRESEKPLTSIKEAKKPEDEQKTENTSKNNLRKPDMDTYIPEEKMALAESDQKDDTDKKLEEDGLKQENSAQKAEKCTGNTDKVDREIRKLKEKKKELEQQINLENDEKKKKQLEAKLSQVERELRQKDNDAYRRQHTVFS